MSNNISILFWLFKAKTNKQGCAPLMLRLTFRGERVQCSTGKLVAVKKWDAVRCKVRGNDDKAIELNKYITTTTNRATQFFNEMFNVGDVCLNNVVDKLLNRNSDNRTLIQLVKFHQEHVKAKVSIDYTTAKYRCCTQNSRMFNYAVP